MPRRYTDAKLDPYELRPVGDKVTGVTVRYDVWIGGGVLGYIRRSVRPRGWQAYTTTGTSRPARRQRSCGTHAPRRRGGSAHRARGAGRD
ncbi:hypothetical protein GCM10027174_10320 [Salinifilum aidingensis]